MGGLCRSASQVVAIKQITEDAQMRSEQQLAFVREMSVLTQVCGATAEPAMVNGA